MTSIWLIPGNRIYIIAVALLVSFSIDISCLRTKPRDVRSFLDLSKGKEEESESLEDRVTMSTWQVFLKTMMGWTLILQKNSYLS